MTSLKFSTPFIALIIALGGFFLIESGISLGKKPDKVAETKVEQTAQGEQDTFNSITPQLKIWYGKISANETKQLELNVLFPYEGKFFIEGTALAYEKQQLAYDKERKIWKTLGQYLAYVTIKKGEEGKIEKTRTRPTVSPRKGTTGPPVISSWYETAKRDTPQDESTGTKPKAIHSHQRTLPLPVSMQLGEAPLELLMSFEPNPKVNEPTKLLLSVLSTAPRDSVCVQLIFPDSIKVIE